MRLGFLGGTGIEGKGLALRFALAGASVSIGSRSAERARATAEEYNLVLGKPLIQGMSNQEMIAASELVFLTIPSEHAVATVETYRKEFSPRSVLIDVTVPIRFVGGRAEYLEPPKGSNSEQIASILPPGVPIVGAFKTIPAHIMMELETPLDCDLFVCGDSADAKNRVMQAGRMLPTLRPLDAGPLSAARTLERMTVLAVHLNRFYKKKGARYRIQGI